MASRALAAHRLGLVVAALLLPSMPLARAAVIPPPVTAPDQAAPTTAEVLFYTQPLVKARLRLPASLHAFAVTAVTPSADDPARFEVAVQFRASTPFGAITAHQARFAMKRTASNRNLWIVTAE